MSGSTISVIVSTYNWPDALRLCLRSLMGQSDRRFEIVVADDGSGPETAELIARMREASPVDIRHFWQEDTGFRKSAILNVAIGEARGDYLIFIDGDCVAQPDFIGQHRKLARPDALVTGSRILLGKALSEKLLQHEELDFPGFRARAPENRLRNEMSKLLPLFLRAPDTSLRDYRRFVWRRIKGCNLACWREDALRAGGFDEELTGWGHEDADFVLRLYEMGIVRRSGAWSTEVLHLWHPEASRDRAETNRKIVAERIEMVEKRRALAGEDGLVTSPPRSPPAPRP